MAAGDWFGGEQRADRQHHTVPGGVEATAVDGNVTLSGVVTYGRQREAAEQAVSGLVGVRNIDVSYDADPLDVTPLATR